MFKGSTYIEHRTTATD